MERAMHLMRSLFFLACWDLVLYCQHIPGVENGATYALSQNDLPSLRPEASRQNISGTDQLDWTVTTWASLITTSS